ncbi:MAG TPA: hypothetical protein VJ233_16775, partial [Hyphomicrobiaceae bacterium]|nr:hypothetical protein [Hyphomicrobiaceae bacterium]
IGPGVPAPQRQSRKNTRTFRVIDKLGDLHKARCGRMEGIRPNLIYPITGSTGMAEVVRTYIELETIADLARQLKEKEVITFSDKLDFTTTFAAGAAVDFEFKSEVGTLRLTKASLAGSASRQDMHSVTVSLASDEDPDLVPSAQRSARNMMIPMAARSPAFPIEQIRDKDVREGLARRDALARNRVLLELQRRRLVDEDRAVATRVLGVPLP